MIVSWIKPVTTLFSLVNIQIIIFYKFDEKEIKNSEAKFSIGKELQLLKHPTINISSDEINNCSSIRMSGELKTIHKIADLYLFFVSFVKKH